MLVHKVMTDRQHICDTRWQYETIKDACIRIYLEIFQCGVRTACVRDNDCNLKEIAAAAGKMLMQHITKTNFKLTSRPCAVSWTRGNQRSLSCWAINLPGDTSFSLASSLLDLDHVISSFDSFRCDCVIFMPIILRPGICGVDHLFLSLKLIYCWSHSPGLQH